MIKQNLEGCRVSVDDQSASESTMIKQNLEDSRVDDQPATESTMIRQNLEGSRVDKSVSL